MPDKRLTLPTMLYSAELVELQKVAQFEVTEDNGLYHVYFDTEAEMEKVREALQVMREDLS
ncbi:hypothetical protein CBQ26_00855 [Deinococcus indicus]|uniref:DUF5659 domain-containing protein n=1 Tax=Deinococcus indicus TaxID=223556 RepID=A0A246BV69_9DEIO|nr:hypothetical protein [Deinococcus indicus]OWL99042.1 hypothetical protein CBQ26_00855 [Deinococcus indicus]